MYPGKQLPKKKKKVLSKLEESLKDEKTDDSKIVDTPDEDKLSEQATTPDNNEDADEGEGEKSVRKSTRTAVIVRQAEREAIRAAMQATMKVSLFPIFAIVISIEVLVSFFSSIIV